MKIAKLIFLLTLTSLLTNPIFSQKKDKSPNIESALKGFKFRSVGPAFMSGRIADIAIDPKNENYFFTQIAS